MESRLFPDECTECDASILVCGYLVPTHNGNGKYYLGNYCPDCEELINRLRPETGGWRLPEHLEDVAVIDENLPDDIEEMETFYSNE